MDTASEEDREMTDYRKYYERDYVGHWDLAHDGDTIVTIVKCEQGELHKPGAKKGEKKPVLTLKGTDKKMVLNATNGKTLAAMFGAHVEGWEGKRIALYRTTTNGPGGNQVECIRIRPTPATDKTRTKEDA